MYRILLALGVITCIIGSFLFGGGLITAARSGILQGMMFLAAGLSIIAICDIQRRVVFLRAALEQSERNQARLMETVVQQGQVLAAFQAATLTRLDALAVQPAVQPEPEPEPVVSTVSYESNPPAPFTLP